MQTVISVIDSRLAEKWKKDALDIITCRRDSTPLDRQAAWATLHRLRDVCDQRPCDTEAS